MVPILILPGLRRSIDEYSWESLRFNRVSERALPLAIQDRRDD